MIIIRINFHDSSYGPRDEITGSSYLSRFNNKLRVSSSMVRHSSSSSSSSHWHILVASLFSKFFIVILEFVDLVMSLESSSIILRSSLILLSSWIKLRSIGCRISSHLVKSLTRVVISSSSLNGPPHCIFIANSWNPVFHISLLILVLERIPSWLVKHSSGSSSSSVSITSLVELRFVTKILVIMRFWLKLSSLVIILNFFHLILGMLEFRSSFRKVFIFLINWHQAVIIRNFLSWFNHMILLRALVGWLLFTFTKLLDSLFESDNAILKTLDLVVLQLIDRSETKNNSLRVIIWNNFLKIFKNWKYMIIFGIFPEEILSIFTWVRRERVLIKVYFVHDGLAFWV